MEPDEPVLQAVGEQITREAPTSVESTNQGEQGAQVGVECEEAEGEEEEEDDDEAASVASHEGVAEDEDEQRTEGSDGPTAGGTGLSDQTCGEDVQAIEAAVASLVMQARGRASTVAPNGPGSSLILERATSEPEAFTCGAEDDSTRWHEHQKHFLILSSSGKPIYSYYGDERSLASLTALISALISVVQSQGDTVQHIRSGSTLIVFMLHGPLYFVAASSLGEPATALRRQLELMYGQLVLIVTTGLERIIQRNPSYDVRSLLDGVGGVLSALAQRMRTDASYVLGGYCPLPVPAADRALATDLLTEAIKQSGAVYGILMADSLVVATARAKQQPLQHPDDVLLLANFVMCNNAYRQGHGEAFSPVCMPHYNSDAFLHAYIHYLDAESGLYLVLLAGSAEAFHQLSAARVAFEQQAAATGVLQRLRALRAPASQGPDGRQQQLNVLAVENLPRPLGGRFGHTPLWAYALRFLPLQQVILSPPSPLHASAPGGRARLATDLAQLHSLLHSPAQPGRPNKLAWAADSHAVLLAARDRDTEVYLVCDPMTDKATAVALLEALRRHFGDKGIAADVTFPLG